MRKGQKHTKETMDKMKKNHWSTKGMTTWNKGLTKEMDSRIRGNGLEHLSEEHKQHLKDNHWSKKEGFVHPMQGKHQSSEAIEKSRLAHLGTHQSPETILKRSIAMKGKHTSSKTEFKDGQMSLDKHYNWLGGKSFGPYGIEFNKQLKEQIRQRDEHRCQQCFHHQNDLNKKLTVHHIDFNKQNNNPSNLISLCNRCHSQTNFNRDGWTGYFQNEIVSRGLK